MSIKIISLKKNIATIIVAMTGVPVIWANQNAPTPDGDYIVLKIPTVRNPGGTDWEGNPNADEEVETQGDRELILSLIAVGERGMEILTNLDISLNLSTNLNLMCQNRVAYVGLESGATDITTIIGKSFEIRAAAEMIFRISKNYSATANTVPATVSIGVGGTVEDGNGGESFPIGIIVE
tara:strand:- start:241 stop:780 length:540 start_codon:yes stop_codon:yes gene_type:complete